MDSASSPVLIFKETKRAALSLGIEILSIEVHDAADVASRLKAVTPRRPDALITIDDPLTLGQRNYIIQFASRHRLPAIYGLRLFADAGGLIAYGASLVDLQRRGAGYVDKILRGAKPSDLPVEQPTKFELVINLKTAKALGLTVPAAVLLRADEVIQY